MISIRKKIIFFIVGALTVGIFSCSKNGNDTTPTPTTSKKSEDAVVETEDPNFKASLSQDSANFLLRSASLDLRGSLAVDSEFFTEKKVTVDDFVLKLKSWTKAKALITNRFIQIIASSFLKYDFSLQEQENFVEAISTHWTEDLTWERFSENLRRELILNFQRKKIPNHNLLRSIYCWNPRETDRHQFLNKDLLNWAQTPHPASTIYQSSLDCKGCHNKMKTEFENFNLLNENLNELFNQCVVQNVFSYLLGQDFFKAKDRTKVFEVNKHTEFRNLSQVLPVLVDKLNDSKTTIGEAFSFMILKRYSNPYLNYRRARFVDYFLWQNILKSFSLEADAEISSFLEAYRNLSQNDHGTQSMERSIARTKLLLKFVPIISTKISAHQSLHNYRSAADKSNLAKLMLHFLGLTVGDNDPRLNILYSKRELGLNTIIEALLLSPHFSSY